MAVPYIIDPATGKKRKPTAAEMRSGDAVSESTHGGPGSAAETRLGDGEPNGEDGVFAESKESVQKLGEDLNNLYTTAQDTAVGEYDKPSAAADNAAANAPTYLENLYTQGDQSTPATTDHTEDAYTSVKNRPEGGYLTDLYDDPTTPTESETLYDERKSEGYGPNAITTRYDGRRAGEGVPGYGESGLDDVGGYIDAPSATDLRINTRSAQGPDVLEGLGERRSGEETAPSYTSDFLGTLGDISPRDSLIGARQRVSEGRSSAGDLLGDFDPNQTAAIGDAYGRVSGEYGPGASETFYDTMLSGTNPAFQRARERTLRETDRALAARGGFDSGQGRKAQQDALLDLEARQFELLGSLAGQSDAAKASRQQTLLGGAKGFDDTILGRLGIQKDLATAKDKYGIEQGGLLAGLAGKEGEFALEKGRLGLDAVSEADEVRDRARDRTDDVLGDLSDNTLEREGQVDDLTGKADDVEFNKQDLGADVRSDVDEFKETKATNIDDLAGAAEDSEFEREKQVDTLAGEASDVQLEREKLKQLIAEGADQDAIERQRILVDAAENADRASGVDAELELENRQQIADLAAKASGEREGRHQQAFENALEVAMAKVGARSPYDFAKAGAMRDSVMATIELELKKMGYDAAQSQAFMKNFIGTLAAIGEIVPG